MGLAAGAGPKGTPTAMRFGHRRTSRIAEPRPGSRTDPNDGWNDAMIKLLERFTSTMVLSAAVLLAGTGAAHATAITGLGGQVFATGGNVVVEVLGSSSSFENKIELFFGYPDTASSFFIGVDNHTGTVDLGANGIYFDLGDELVFGIRSPDHGGSIFLMGGAERNSDGKAHASVSTSVPGAGFMESWTVGFEDLFKGGDNDFNDAIVRISQSGAPEPVPEPVTLLMLGFGFAGLSFIKRKPEPRPYRYT